jgi:hypothetical protein
MGPPSAPARPPLRPSLSASTSTLPTQSRVSAARRHSIRNSIDLTGLPAPLSRIGDTPGTPSPPIMPQSTAQPALQKVPSIITARPSPPIPLLTTALPKHTPRTGSVNLPSPITREDPEGLKASTSSPVQISPSSTAIPVSTKPIFYFIATLTKVLISIFRPPSHPTTPNCASNFESSRLNARTMDGESVNWNLVSPRQKPSFPSSPSCKQNSKPFKVRSPHINGSWQT